MRPMVLVALSLGSAILAGCATAPLPAPALPMVRLYNASAATLANVRVQYDRVPVDYGTLAPGATSRYRMAEGAHRYARIEATVDGRAIIVQPIDFVGETVLVPGYYTYRLSLDAQSELRIETSTDATPPL